MICYQHHERTAVGLCRACQKGVCPECAVDTGRGLACCPGCAAEVKSLTELMDRNKRIYGLAGSARLPALGVLIYGLFAVLMMVFGAWFYRRSNEMAPFLVAMGAALR